MSRRKTTFAALVVATMAPVLVGLTATESTGATTVPTCPSASLTRTGNQTTAVNQTNNAQSWKLTGAVWNNTASKRIDYPVRSDAVTKACIIGGSVDGAVPRTATRDQWYNGEDGGTRMGGEAFRQTLTKTSGNWLVMRDTHAEDFEDAYDPDGLSTANTLFLDHVEARWIRDDCIENEGAGSPQVPMNVYVRNSLFDGCFTGFAQRPPGTGGAVQNGSGAQSLTVENSLMYIQPQPLGPNYCSSSKVTSGRCAATSTKNVWLGAHGIWKWSAAAAKNVTIRNSVFRLDQASYSSCSPQQWPAGTYENVTLVWAGKGSYSTAGGCKNTLPAGVKLTTDTGVWDRAKTAWLAGS